jgi:hypothetical protein
MSRSNINVSQRAEDFPLQVLSLSIVRYCCYCTSHKNNSLKNHEESVEDNITQKGQLVWQCLLDLAYGFLCCSMSNTVIIGTVLISAQQFPNF